MMPDCLRCDYNWKERCRNSLQAVRRHIHSVNSTRFVVVGKYFVAPKVVSVGGQQSVAAVVLFHSSSVD